MFMGEMKKIVLDETDEIILRALQKNARIAFQKLGDIIGMSRVAAKKRVRRLEDAGVIRGYNTAIYCDDEKMVIIDIIAKPERFDQVLRYVSARTAFVRQIYISKKDNRIHVIAVSTDIADLQYLLRMLLKQCKDDTERFDFFRVTDIVKDVDGGIDYEEYERKVSEAEGSDE